MELNGLRDDAQPKNCKWIMHRDLETQIKKLKDGNGQYLWQGSIDGKAPNTLLGFPVHLSEYCNNTLTTQQLVAILGNISFYYIVDCLEVHIQRLVELYSETDQTGYICRQKQDGMPVLPSAFVRVKLA